jgi:hypothetical protein
MNKNMKTKIILLLLISANLFGWNNPIENVYLNIKGTRLSIIPPKGFKESKTIIGLEKNDNAAIQVMDLVGGNFESNTLTYTKSEFEKKGITVLEFEELKVDGFRAKFSHIKGKENNESVQVVFGDESFCAMVIAVFPTSMRNELFSEIKESFLKIKYDKNLKVDPFASSAFKVEKNESKFKFAKASANMFIFSENGVVKNSYNDEPMIMITSYPFDKSMTKEKLLEDAVKGLVKQGFVLKETKNTSKENINSYNSIEAEFYFEHKSEIKLSHITILIKDDKAIVVYGNAKSKFEENIREFKKLINSLKIK